MACPPGDIGFKESAEFLSAGWQFPCAGANLRELQVHDGIDQPAHQNFSIAAHRHSKRGDNSNALICLNQRDLRIQ